jgi:hypothetical protein
MIMKSISFTGLVEFMFDKKMAIPNNYKEWRGNNSYLLFDESMPLSVSVLPSLDQDPLLLNFSWTVVEYTEDHFFIQILFYDAIYVSMAPGPSRDIL